MIIIRKISIVLLLSAPIFFSNLVADAKAVEQSAQEKADIAKIVGEAKDGIPYTLNLSKAHHMRHVVRALGYGGHTEANSPMLFKTLRALKSVHAKKAPSQKITALQTGASGPQPANAIIDVGVISGSATNFSSSAITSNPQPTIKSTVTLQLFNAANNSSIGNPSSNTQFGNGVDLNVNATGTWPTTPKNSDQVLSLATFFNQPSGGGGPVLQTVRMTKAVDTLLSPPVVTEPAQKAAHVSLPNINVCLSRTMTNLADCDYGPYEAPTATPDVQFPMKGSVQYSSAVPATLSAQNAQIQFLIWKDDGGACPLGALGNLFQHFTTSNSGTPTVSWDFNNAQFGKPCFQTVERIDVSFMVAVQTANSSPGYVSAFVTSQTPATPANTTQIKYLTFMWGCLLPGAQILMDDGTYKNVEDIKVGEFVKANGARTKTRVTATYKGNEDALVYLITDSFGHKLEMTSEHPILLMDGSVVLARQLQRLMTEKTLEISTTKGPATLKSVTSRTYKGSVYNLKLQHAKNTYKDTNFYANAIMVGDNRMQKHWGLWHRKDHRDILARIPVEWHQDYKNWRSRTPASNR